MHKEHRHRNKGHEQITEKGEQKKTQIHFQMKEKLQ